MDNTQKIIDELRLLFRSVCMKYDVHYITKNIDDSTITVATNTEDKELFTIKMEKCTPACDKVECQFNQIQSKQKTPYCCPVCGGKGDVPQGFYNPNAYNQTWTCNTTEMCKTCGGTGVLWN